MHHEEPTESSTLTAIKPDSKKFEVIHLSHMDKRLAAEGYYLDSQQAEMVRLVLSKPYFGADRDGRVRALRCTGPAGSGKTFLAEMTAKVMTKATKVEHKHFYFQATRNMAEDEMFFGIMPGNAGEGFTRYEGVLLEAVKASVEGPVVLTLDEWDKARPQADAMLLDFLQSGRISHPAVRINGKPENLIVFVCTNDERELSEPLQRRCAALDLGHPPVEIMERILVKECPGSGFIPHALKIYAQSVQAGLNKPATAQELVQLIQALEDSENVTAISFTAVLNTFVLKTAADRKRFKEWCDANKQPLDQLAAAIRGTERTITTYTPFDPTQENYRPIELGDRPDTSNVISPLRDWARGYPERENIVNKGHALFEAKVLPLAVAHIPAITSDPDKWAVVDNAAVSFDPLSDLDGYVRITNLKVRQNTIASVVFTMRHPNAPHSHFTIQAIAKNAEKLYAYDPQVAVGTYIVPSADKTRNSRVWFEARRDRIEVVVTTDHTAVPLRNVLFQLLGGTYMTWWLGEQDEESKYWYTCRAYGSADPRLHGLFAVNMHNMDGAVVQDMKNRNKQRGLRVKKMLQRE